MGRCRTDFGRLFAGRRYDGVYHIYDADCNVIPYAGTMISIMLPRAAVSAERINEVISAEKSITDKPDAATFDKASLRGNVTFNHVSFRYPDAKGRCSDRYMLTANAGETTAVIGSTGNGQSTLINLIPRFF